MKNLASKVKRHAYKNQNELKKQFKKVDNYDDGISILQVIQVFKKISYTIDRIEAEDLIQAGVGNSRQYLAKYGTLNCLGWLGLAL